MIPDVPVDLKVQEQREASAAREALFEGERHYFRDRPRSRASSSNESSRRASIVGKAPLNNKDDGTKNFDASGMVGLDGVGMIGHHHGRSSPAYSARRRDNNKNNNAANGDANKTSPEFVVEEIHFSDA
jgi:hypothetical protein